MLGLPGSRQRRGVVGHAFTLVELLVVITVIGVIIGLALPGLRASRIAASQTASLANLRQVGGAFSQYTDMYGLYPFGQSGPMNPDDPEGDSIVIGWQTPWEIEHFWPHVFLKVAPWREHWRTWLSPGREASEIAEQFAALGPPPSGITLYSSYLYSNSFIGTPGVWDATSSPGARKLHPVRPEHVAQPSGKALVYDGDRSYLREAERDSRPIPVLSADGSGSFRLESRCVRPVQNLLSTRTPRVFHDTPGGVLGRDY